MNSNRDADMANDDKIDNVQTRRPTLEKMRSGFQLDYAYELKEAIVEYKLENKVQKLSRKNKKRSLPKLKLFGSTK